MANTMISISSIITNAEEICITGKDLDKILLSDGDLSDEFEEVSFTFSRAKKNEMAYIYKVASSKVKDAKSLKEMLDKMVNSCAILTLNDSFKVKH